jgi:hypothetical protein
LLTNPFNITYPKHVIAENKDSIDIPPRTIFGVVDVRNRHINIINNPKNKQRNAILPILLIPIALPNPFIALNVHIPIMYFTCMYAVETGAASGAPTCGKPYITVNKGYLNNHNDPL